MVAAPAPALSAWWSWLANPAMPGAGPAAPRPRALAFTLVAAWLALQVTARYRFRVLYDDSWYAVHLAVGLAAVLAILAACHGVRFPMGWSRRTWAVLAVGMAAICGYWYLGRIDGYWHFFRGAHDRSAWLAPLWPFLYFSLCSVLFRLALPFAWARLALRLRPSELGLGISRERHAVWPVYLGLFLLVLPSVVHAAGTVAFQRRYPLFRGALEGGDIDLAAFLAYQAAYLLVFVSGESFWRGFLTFGTERDLGAYGILFMLVPYVFGHFGKPMPETLGAIAAGTVLGWLALKHRSVWPGVALHYAVALSMDLLACRAQGIGIR